MDVGERALGTGAAGADVFAASAFAVLLWLCVAITTGAALLSEAFVALPDAIRAAEAEADADDAEAAAALPAGKDEEAAAVRGVFVSEAVSRKRRRNVGRVVRPLVALILRLCMMFLALVFSARAVIDVARHANSADNFVTHHHAPVLHPLVRQEVSPTPPATIPAAPDTPTLQPVAPTVSDPSVDAQPLDTPTTTTTTTDTTQIPTPLPLPTDSSNSTITETDGETISKPDLNACSGALRRMQVVLLLEMIVEVIVVFTYCIFVFTGAKPPAAPLTTVRSIYAVLVIALNAGILWFGGSPTGTCTFSVRFCARKC